MLNFTEPPPLWQVVSGYYAPWRKAIVITRMGSGTGFDPDELIAHEAVHVYQHLRHAAFSRAWFQTERTSEAFSVIRCLSEGEATAGALAFRLLRCGRKLEDVEADAFGRAARQGVSGVVEWHPYVFGARFVLAHVRRAGWSGVGDLYAQPPPSTEQVLHPEKLGQDEPTALDWEDPPSDEASLLLEDTLGELHILGWLSVFRGRAEAFPASTGWDGDTARVYELADGRVVSVWATLWDREEDAVQFEQAASQVSPAVLRRAGRVVVLAGSEDPRLSRSWAARVAEELGDLRASPADGDSTRLVEERWSERFRPPAVVDGRWEVPMLGVSVPAPFAFRQVLDQGVYVLRRERAGGLGSQFDVSHMPLGGPPDLDSLVKRLETIHEASPLERVLAVERVEVGGRAAVLAEYAVGYRSTWLRFRYLTLYVADDDGLLVVCATVHHEHSEEAWPVVREALLGVRVGDGR